MIEEENIDKALTVTSCLFSAKQGSILTFTVKESELRVHFYHIYFDR